MPIKVEIEGKGVVAEFPDGTPQNVIDAAVRRDFLGPKTDTSSEIVKPIPMKPSEKMNPLREFLVGTGYGMENLLLGAKQRGAQIGEAVGLVKPETVTGIQGQVAENRRLALPFLNRPKETETRPYFNIKGEMKTRAVPLGNPFKAGQVVGESAITAPIPGGFSGGIVKRAITGALAGSAAGALQPTLEGESTGTNILTGAGAGGATSAAMSIPGKIYNTVTGKIPLNETRDLSKKFGVRTTLGEETKNPIIQKMETWLEGVPVIGLKGFREKQQKEAEQASKGFLARFIVDPNAPDIAQANRQYANSLFESLNKSVAGISKQEIAPTETRTAAKALLDRYPDIFKKFQDTKREGVIQSIVTDTRPKEDPFSVLSNLYGFGGKAPVDKTLTFEDAWTLRQGLGEMIGQARKKLAGGEVDKTTLAELRKVYGAIDGDMDKWAKAIGRPDVKEALTTANDAYKQYVVKYDIIQRAMDKAEGVVGAGEMFSPKKFSTTLKNVAYKNKNLKTFGPQEIEEMTGLVNIMQVVKRAGQFAENPPTGNRWGLPTMLGGLAGYAASGTPGGMATAGGALTMTAISRFLTGTESGKILALSASKIEPNSSAMQGIMKQVYNQLPKVGANIAVDETPNWKEYLQ